MDNISQLRQEIDQVHKELHALLERRRDLTQAIWKIKQEQGLPFFDAKREDQVMEDFVALSAQSSNGLVSHTDEAFAELLKGVMNSLLREYEKYLKSKY